MTKFVSPRVPIVRGIDSNGQHQYASPPPPGMMLKAANLAGAAFRAAEATMKGEKVRASQSEVDRRLTICKTCEHFVDNPMKCRKCGCFLNLKARLETEHCPIAKW